MKGNLLIMLFLSAWLYSAVAQPPAQRQAVIVESMHFLPKAGMADKMEAAVKAHIARFHPAGPYAAGLRSVDYGVRTGWYVWVMGPASYAALDPREDQAAHNDDWNKNVDPLIEKYDPAIIFEYDTEMSTGREMLARSDHYDTWAVDVKSNEMKRFNQIIEQLSKTYASLGNRAFLVYRSQVHYPGGADVGLVTSFTDYTDFGSDWGVQQAFEKLYGAGSWDKMMTVWNEVVVDYNEEIRSVVR
ncbi:MAG: hypothetical protein K1X61_09020 [Chitinophagales bacterium]|nr:hypothetical protein [Chitinophagales bacterium]